MAGKQVVGLLALVAVFGLAFALDTTTLDVG
jgi:hypothetical protein